MVSLTQLPLVGVPQDTIDRALENVAERKVGFLAVSGWMGSGKDTLAPLLLDKARYDNVVHLSFATALKDEVQQYIDLIRQVVSGPTIAERTAVRDLLISEHTLDEATADYYATVLVDEVFAHGPELTSRTRTAVMRQVNQHHGTGCRRTQDPNYWVKRSLAPAVRALADGMSVYYSDVRFENEVGGAQALGAFALRIDISRDTQLARLAGRDGSGDIDPAVFTHPSETSLDDYAHFDARISNDGALADTLDAAFAAYDAR